MSLYANITKDALQARKAKDTIRATLLSTLLSEAYTYAKNEQRETQDKDVLQALKYFVKNLQKSLEIRDTEKERMELNILLPYVPVEKLPTLEEAVEKVLSENAGQPINKLVGLVMRETKGTANSAMAKELLETRINS